MGGIVATGISINCDRCGKVVSVTDNQDAEFYKAYAQRETQDEHMFVGSLIIPGHFDKPIDMDFEYMCSGCYKAVLGYLAKIDKGLEKLLPPKKAKGAAAKGPNGEAGPETGSAKVVEEKVEPKEQVEAKVVIKDETKAKTEPEPEPETPPPAAEEGSEYSDDDLFAP